MDIFLFNCYKELVNSKVNILPNKGRGEYKKIAEYLGVSSVLISQIFNGHKDISIEQGFKLADYFGLLGLEKKYFLTLIHEAKAGLHDLKKYYTTEIEELRNQAKAIENRVTHSNLLSEEDKGIFYSDWRYSAIRLSCDLDHINTILDLTSCFNLNEKEIKKYTDFLLKTGLIKVQSGKFTIGPSSTHLSKASPYIKNHHRNWRLKSIESIDKLTVDEIMYTAPMAISQDLFIKLNKKILMLIDDFVKDATSSESSELYFLNIDLRKLM